MKKLFFLFLIMLCTNVTFAQTTTGKQISKATPKKKAPKQDGYIFKETTAADTVIPYSAVNREDVAYSTRIWREIDLRDRGNAVLASPKVNLIGVIYEALNNGELDMYPADDEDFQKGETISQKKINEKSSSAVDTAFLGINPSTNEVNRADNEFFAVSYPIIRIKEDWILDIRRGVFEPRIIGIAPVRIDVKIQVDNNGNQLI